MTKSKFFISLHHAKRAGKHHDIRFKMPDSKNWMSFACRKDIPVKQGEKRMIYRTNDHSEKEALMVGYIEDGYGAGLLEEWDSGKCDILVFEQSKHIVIKFYGKKIKGIYHFLRYQYKGQAAKKNQSYIFFKAKNQDYKATNEWNDLYFKGNHNE